MITPDDRIDIGEDLVRYLLENQHPDLATRKLVHVASGWDNVVWGVGSDLLARLPRRALAAPLVANEKRWLPDIAPGLSLPVPVPIRSGAPTDRYLWEWSIVPWFTGVPADLAGIEDTRSSARLLGQFLRSLHTPAPTDAPENQFRGVTLKSRVATVEQRLLTLSSEIDVTSIPRIWKHALETDPWDSDPLWLHGDLHPGNILVSDGSVSAVVDFGDICSGDPATDIASFWMLLPNRCWDEFTNSYGQIPPELESRSLGWAVILATMLLEIGISDGNRSYEAVGRTTLERIARR